jgi:hypothetical protein
LTDNILVPSLGETSLGARAGTTGNSPAAARLCGFRYYQT